MKFPFYLGKGKIMYEVRKTDKNRFAVRLKDVVGLFVFGTGIITDSHNSNIVVYQNKEEAFQKAIEFNRKVSELFSIFIDKDKDDIINELGRQNFLIEECKKNIEILNSVLHCKYQQEKK